MQCFVFREEAKKTSQPTLSDLQVGKRFYHFNICSFVKKDLEFYGGTVLYRDSRQISLLILREFQRVS